LLDFRSIEQSNDSITRLLDYQIRRVAVWYD